MRPFDTSGVFTVGPHADGLRRAAVQGAGITLLNQIAIFTIQLVATIVVARMIAPADYGVVTMVTTISLLLASCGQVGFPEAIMQREEVNHQLASNLFWINIAVSVVLSLAFAATGPLLAHFYQDQRVAYATFGISLTIFLTNLPVLHIALLRRAMRFTAVTSNDVIARAVSVTVALALASRGYGYGALIVSAVALSFSTSCGAWVLCRWIPGPPRRVPGTRDSVLFAAHVFARFGTSYITRNTDNLLVGWRFGAASMGLYKKAYDLFALSSNQILSAFPVGVSTLSRLTKSPVQYRRYFLGGLSILALIGMAASGELGLIGKDLVVLLLGPRWEATGAILVFFAPGIGAMLIYSVHGMIHLSIGTPDRWFRWGFIELFLTVLLFLIALPWGPTGIACAWTISYWTLIIPAFWYAGKPIGFSFRPVLAITAKYFLAAILAQFLCTRLLRDWLLRTLSSTPSATILRIIIEAISFVVAYIAFAMALHRSLEPVAQLARLVPEFLPHSWSTKYEISSVTHADIVSQPMVSHEN
jgi:PST family polysaccharide transporter